MTLMDIFDLPQRAEGNDLDAIPELQPQSDYTLRYLRERALDGAVPVYFAAIPRDRIRPFDTAFDPANHPVGAAAVARTEADWRAEIFPRVWVYPTHDAYVLSDDYIPWAAAQRAQPDYLPCWVLCYPSVAGAIYIEGPIGAARVRQLLQGSAETPAQ
ncbi:MAG: hypothetical protein WBQ26_08640 [Gemmatimonadaceae bacterium]|nr:hypothetical protein [Gemmatimonadaceae bacterium]